MVQHQSSGSMINQALKILLVCKSRLQIVREYLVQEDLKRYEMAQKSFDKAFLNFKNYDYLMQKSGIDLITNEHALKLLQEIQLIHSESTMLLEQILVKTKNQLVSANHHAKGLNQYAHAKYENKFVKVI